MEHVVATDPEWQWIADAQSGWQFGEQGSLLAIVDALELNNSSACEIGGGDGGDLPLTLAPLLERGWRVTVWEADSEKRNQLTQRFPNAEVCGTWKPGDYVTATVLVIDIDGLDYVPFALATIQWRPALVMVEHSDLCFEGSDGVFLPGCIQDARHNGRLCQATMAALDMIAAGSYTRVAYSRVNSIYVANQLLFFLRSELNVRP